MDYNKICSEILKLNPKIRFAGIYNAGKGEVYEKLPEGINRMLDKEQTQQTLVKAYMRWKTRESLVPIVGEPVYSMTKYKKITRISMPCGKEGLLMVSTETDLEPHEIVDDILKLKEKFDDKKYNKEERIATLNF